MKKHFSFVLCLSLMYPMFGQLTWPATSPGPDSYGYTWRTSDDPSGPQFDWVEIISNGLGTEVTGLTDDNHVGPFPLGIDFPYYWQTKSEFCVGSNGYISLGPDCGTIASIAIGFPPTPTPTDPNDVLAAFMSDLSFAGTNNIGRVFYYTDTAQNQFILTFDNVPFWTSGGNEWNGSNTFQVILDAADSTVTYQYQSMSGNWNNSYDGADYPFVVGIENTTGQFGFNAPGINATAADKPVNGSAIRFYQPATPLISVTDLNVSAVQNPEIAGFLLPWPQNSATNAFPLRGEISNIGNTDISSDIIVLGSVKDTNDNLLWQAPDTIIGGLEASEAGDLHFKLPFNPPQPGPYRYCIQITNTGSIGDINASNNVKEVELYAVDTTQGEITFGYLNDQPVSLPGNYGAVSWLGNMDDSGGGVLLKSFAYPLKIIALEYVLLQGDGCIPLEGIIAEIHSNNPDTDLPDSLLASITVPVGDVSLTNPPSWTRVPVDPPIEIEADGFFVSWIQDDDCIILAEEEASPLSKRNYEILNLDWATFRFNASGDMMIRAIVDLDSANVVDIDPEKPLVHRFSVFPNPNNGQFEVEAVLNQATEALIRVYDLQGRKKYQALYPKSLNIHQQMNLEHLSSGMYLIELRTEKEQYTHRILIE